jgi:hypothetical protein
LRSWTKLKLRALLATALLLCGCAVVPVGSVGEFAVRGGANSFEAFGRLPGRQALVLDAPFDRQDSLVACGAHVLASVIRYWRPGEASVTGEAIFAAHPPADMASGYSMQELVELAGEHGLSAYGVRLEAANLVEELEKGRPVLIPIYLPFVYEQTTSLFDPDPPVVAQLKTLVLRPIGMASEITGAGMLAHFVLVVGHAKDRFVLLDPVLGYRTISKSRLERYREKYDRAGLIFSPKP